jgi:hypothetical protein
MRGMRKWSIVAVAHPGRRAANELWPPRAQPGEITITRLGSYTRVVLTKPELAAAPVVRRRKKNH